MQIKRLSILMCMITLCILLIAQTDMAQTVFSTHSKSYPVNVPFKYHVGADRYWHATCVVCTGRDNEGLNTEAVRVVKSLKRWIPGSKYGQPVRVQSAVYVKFSL